MTICKNCGTVYDEFYNICPKCGTPYSPDSEQSGTDVPAKEMPEPQTAQNEYHREYDSSATVMLSPDAQDDDDATIPNPPGSFPFRADVPPAEAAGTKGISETIPLQAENASENNTAEQNSSDAPSAAESDPDATVIYSSSEAAGLPVQQDETTIPVTMPNAQYGDEFSANSPTSFAPPPQQTADDFSNTQDVFVPSAFQVQNSDEQMNSYVPVPPVVNSEMQAEKKAKKKGSAGKIIAIILVACVVLAGIGIGVYFLFFNNSSSQEESGDHISLGEKYLSEGNWDDAIVQFKKAIENDPNNADLYLKLADAYEHKKEYGNAIYYLEIGYTKTGSNTIKAKLDELRKAHPTSTPEELIGTWAYNYDADSLSPEQKALLEYMNLDTAMAILPNGQFDSYLKVSDRYSHLGSGTWTLSGDTFTLSNYGSEQKYTYKDGKLYDNSSSGGIFFEKTSDDVPEASRSKLTVPEPSVPEEESSDPEEESSEPEEESSEPEEESSEPEEESSSAEKPAEVIKEEDVIGTWAYKYDPNLLTEEQRAMLEYLDMDTAMAVLPNGQIDAYLKVGSRYSLIGSGTWTISGDTFTVTSSGSEQKYSYKDGILYDKSTAGGVYFEKISSDVPDESKSRLNSQPEDSSEPEEESSDPETSLPKPLNNSAAGTWNIAFDETAVSPELIAQFKETTLDEFLMILKEDGTVYARQSLKGKVKMSGTGTWTISGNTVNVTLSNETQKFTLKDGMMTAPDVLGPAYFEKTSSSTDFPAQSETSKPEVNPDDVIKTARTTDGYTINDACKTYYAGLLAGTINGDKNQTQASRRRAAQNATIKEALEYSGSSDLLKYLDQMSADDSGNIFYENGTDTRKANSVKTSVVRSSNGSGKLGDLYGSISG